MNGRYVYKYSGFDGFSEINPNQICKNIIDDDSSVFNEINAQQVSTNSEFFNCSVDLKKILDEPGENLFMSPNIDFELNEPVDHPNDQLDTGVPCLVTENVIKNEQKCFEKLSKLLRDPAYTGLVNKFNERVINSNSDSALADILAVVGAKNNTILKVQSRIKKNSHKNRFKALKELKKGNKQRNLFAAVLNNCRNLQTQSKK